MFILGTPAWEIVARSVVVFFFVLLGLIWLGRKELGQMNAPDLVLALLLANAVQNAMIGPDSSLGGGLLAAATLLVLARVIGALRVRNKKAEGFFGGEPALLVHDGRFIEAHLRHEQVTPGDVEMAMREHGLDDLGQVKSAVLEMDGSISIIPAGASVLPHSQHRVKRVKHRRSQ